MSAPEVLGLRVFGIRHLSPGAAWQLRDYLDTHQPKAVLVEGPVDFTPLIPEITANGVVPPIALLAYTQELPVRTSLYPFAIYSPEYQALMWAMENKVEARFIDLPSGNMIALQDSQNNNNTQEEEYDDDDYTQSHEDYDEYDTDDSEVDFTDSVSDDINGDIDDTDDTQAQALWQAEQNGIDAVEADGFSSTDHNGHTRDHRLNAYDTLANRAGMPDYETYWEQVFEHNRMKVQRRAMTMSKTILHKILYVKVICVAKLSAVRENLIYLWRALLWWWVRFMPVRWRVQLLAPHLVRKKTRKKTQQTALSKTLKISSVMNSWQHYLSWALILR